MKWGVRVADLGEEPSIPVVMGSHYDLVVIADGGWSELRTRYFISARPEYAGYVAWRFRVSAADVQGFQAFGEYANEHYRAIFLPVAQNDGADFFMGGTAVSVPAEDLPADAPADSPVNRQASSDGSAAASDASPAVEKRKADRKGDFIRQAGGWGSARKGRMKIN